MHSGYIMNGRLLRFPKKFATLQKNWITLCSLIEPKFRVRLLKIKNSSANKDISSMIWQIFPLTRMIVRMSGTSTHDRDRSINPPGVKSGNLCITGDSSHHLLGVKENVTIDWTVKENVKAKMRVMVNGS
jgi:hypothetical protein